MNNRERQKKQNTNFILIIIYLLSVGLHYFLADFEKKLAIYPDELRYYMIARSLFYGEGVSIRGIPATFQKLGYSFILSPFFAVEDAILRIKLMGLVNCMIMSFSIVPLWLICKELKLTEKAAFAGILLLAIWPDLIYTSTFMSEVLYWTVGFFFIYIWISNERKQSFLLALLQGVICYIGYLTKEIFLAFFLDCILFEIIYPVVRHFTMEHEDKLSIKKMLPLKRALCLLIFVVTFCICHIITKRVFFRGMGNSYQQMSLDALNTTYNIAYFFYAFIYHIMAVLAATLIIPVVYPLAFFQKMEEQMRKLFLYLIIFFLIASATIAYTISIRENLGEVVPRIHLRYMGVGVFLVFVIFVGIVPSVRDKTLHAKRRLIAEILVLVSGVVFIFFKGAEEIGVDQYCLAWYNLIVDRFSVWYPPQENGLILYKGAVLGNVLLISFVVLFHCFYRKWRKGAIGFFVCVLLLVCFINNDKALEEAYRAHYGEENIINEVIAINEYFDHLNNNPTIVYFTDGTQINSLCEYMDTYMDHIEKLCYVDDTFLKNLPGGEEEHSVENMQLLEHIWDGEYKNISSMDYIILEKFTDLEGRKLENVEIIPELGGDYYLVYRNLEPAKILIK